MKALPLGQTPAQSMLLALGPQIERAADEALLRAARIQVRPRHRHLRPRRRIELAGGAMPALDDCIDAP
jgi:hypothetical protein